MVSEHTKMKQCSAEGCEREFPDHRWGAIKATTERGWFIEKPKPPEGEHRGWTEEKAWCAQHVPDWVEGWRASRRDSNSH